MHILIARDRVICHGVRVAHSIHIGCEIRIRRRVAWIVSSLHSDT